MEREIENEKLREFLCMSAKEEKREKRWDFRQFLSLVSK